MACPNVTVCEPCSSIQERPLFHVFIGFVIALGVLLLYIMTLVGMKLGCPSHIGQEQKDKEVKPEPPTLSSETMQTIWITNRVQGKSYGYASIIDMAQSIITITKELLRTRLNAPSPHVESESGWTDDSLPPHLDTSMHDLHGESSDDDDDMPALEECDIASSSPPITTVVSTQM